MRYKTLTTCVLFLFCSQINQLQSQVTEAEKKLREVTSDTITGWKKGGVMAINLSQTSLKNWASGGQNSVALNGILSLFANYKKDKSAWDNSLDLGYGLLKQGKEADYIKTDDKIDFVSKYGREAFGHFYYSGLLNFRTQMSPGYKYPDMTNKISNFFAPAYLLIALGLDYKPNPNISIFIAPVTGKFTFVTDPELSESGAFGVTPGKKSRSELGGYLRAIFTKNDFSEELLKNISITSKIDLFSNYRTNPQNIDISWETLIAMKVNKFISVNFNTHLIYDDNIKIPVDRDNDGLISEYEKSRPGSRIQFKEIFGAGFSFNF